MRMTRRMQMGSLCLGVPKVACVGALHEDKDRIRS